MYTSQNIIELLEKHQIDIEFASEYGEPGYELDADKDCILFANWNTVEEKIGRKTLDQIERKFELEWSDEWLIDYDNDCKAYRTSPDSYDWLPSYQYTDSGELFTRDSVADYEDDYVDYLINNSDHANLFLTHDKLIELGFIKFNQETFESGLHEHMNDNPHKILSECQKVNPGDYIFSDLTNSQFCTQFNVYYRPTQMEEI